jgi:hypothetical protein
MPAVLVQEPGKGRLDSHLRTKVLLSSEFKDGKPRNQEGTYLIPLKRILLTQYIGTTRYRRLERSGIKPVSQARSAIGYIALATCWIFSKNQPDYARSRPGLSSANGFVLAAAFATSK